MDPRAPTAPERPAIAVDAASVATDERELIASVLRRDRGRCQAVAGHIDAVHACVRHRLTPLANLLNDVVQDVFLAALNGLPAFAGRSSLRTWLLDATRFFHSPSSRVAR